VYKWVKFNTAKCKYDYQADSALHYLYMVLRLVLLNFKQVSCELIASLFCALLKIIISNKRNNIMQQDNNKGPAQPCISMHYSKKTTANGCTTRDRKQLIAN
jgi:hypothetical protein